MKATTIRRKLAILLVGGLFVLVAALAAGCGDDDSEGNDNGTAATEAAEPQEVNLLLSFRESISWTPLLVARDLGYFEEEGLTINTQVTEGSGFVTQQIIAGNEKFGWAGADSDVIAFSKQPDLRLVMCNEGQSIFRITTPADSDIQSVEDLAGGTLGISERGGGEEPLVTAALTDAGIFDEVRQVPIGGAGPTSQKALTDGEVDAWAEGYVDVVSMQSVLELRDITPDKFSATPGNCFIMLKETLEDEETRQQAVGITRAWKKGMIFAEANPEAALEIVCGVVPEDCEDREFAAALLDMAISLYQPVNESFEPGQVDAEGVQTSAGILADNEAIDAPVDVTPLVASPEGEAVIDEWMQVDADAVREEAANYQP